MMKVVEKSSTRLRLSNADPLGERVFVFTIIAVLLSGMFISAKVIKPACWSGFVMGCILLILLIKELPRNFNTEICFDQGSNQFKVIKHPWFGRQIVVCYALSDVTGVKIVARPRHVHHYPEFDYDYAETEHSVEIPEYDVEISIRSGNSLKIYGATHLVPTIVEFLGLTYPTA